MFLGKMKYRAIAGCTSDKDRETGLEDVSPRKSDLKEAKGRAVQADNMEREAPNQG